MPLSPEEFKDLQEFWYNRLKEEGFKDIEKVGEMRKASSLYRGIEFELIDQKERYFALMGHAVNDQETGFRSEIDRHIMTRHADGARIRVIVDELAINGTPRTRKSVRMIIRRYESAWGIKYYSSKPKKKQ